MNKNITKFKYRSDIDGLRGIAVIGVVVCHAGLGVPGGFVGVDIFFVISGFLITSLLLRDLHRGSFSIVDFWERRARRIFPALAVVVAVCLVVGWFLMLPFGYQVLGQSSIALTVFSSNIHFWRISGYFDPSAEENPLLHTWSLSVEEQFYLIVPLVLWLIFWVRYQRYVGVFIIMGVIASFTASIYWLNRDPTGAFYLLPPRAWELGLGSMLALVRPIANKKHRSLIGWGGMVLVAYSYFFYNPDISFPGLSATIPVMGAVMLIWSGMIFDDESDLSGANRLLSSKVLVAIGLVSYSFYLWHWPFFAFHRYLFSQSPSVLIALVYIAVSLFISVLSLHFVERPFRERSLAPSRKHIFIFTGLMSGVILISGVVLWRTRGISSRLPRVVAEFDAVKGDNPSRAGVFEKYEANENFVSLGESGKPCRVILWGDSHAHVLFSLVDKWCRANHVSAIASTSGGVAPVIGWSGGRAYDWIYERNVKKADSIMAHIQELSKSKDLSKVQIILAFRWSYYVMTPQRHADDPYPRKGFDDALILTIQKLEELGLKVAVMREVPIFNQHVPKAMALHHWRGLALPHLTKQEHEDRALSYEPLIERIKKETPHVEILDPFLSLTSKNRVDFLDEQGILLYRDEGHLTTAGSMRLWGMFNELLSK